MAKVFELRLDSYQAETLMRPIRNKLDVIRIWMNAIKFFLINNPAPPGREAVTVTLVVKSMSRLFCAERSGSRVFSVAFPFSVYDVQGALSFRARECNVDVDNQASSIVIGLLQSHAPIGEAGLLEFADSLDEAGQAGVDAWSLLRSMLLADDAYIRYDHDPDRVNGHLHPLHHLDISYSATGGFKLGLRLGITRTELEAILDTETDCYYVQAAQ